MHRSSIHDCHCKFHQGKYVELIIEHSVTTHFKIVIDPADLKSEVPCKHTGKCKLVTRCRSQALHVHDCEYASEQRCCQRLFNCLCRTDKQSTSTFKSQNTYLEDFKKKEYLQTAHKCGKSCCPLVQWTEAHDPRCWIIAYFTILMAHPQIRTSLQKGSRKAGCLKVT